jgi:hypothetical protein
MRKILFTALLLLAPRVALACPVCFGQNDSPMASATNMGIIVMLGVVGVVLGGFASFIIYLNRRAKLVAAMSAPAEGGRYEPSEGTAQC